MTTTYSSIRPGQIWLDTEGKPIQAHGGSMLVEDGTFYWYGENKEFTTGDGEVWHGGVRCYSSTDLYNWTDLGLIIEPDTSDPSSPLHPRQHLDRPHIVHDRQTGKYICWVKVMGEGNEQTASILTSDRLLGPYTLVRSFHKPAGMSMGDFDIAVVGDDAVIFFEHPHSEVIAVSLTQDRTDVEHDVSRHFQGLTVPESREAPAHFERKGRHFLATSGTSGYYPNRSDIAVAASPHGPWQKLGDLHPDDPSGTSFRSQISCIFPHPGREDLYIAMADRWLPHLSESESDQTELFGRLFAGGIEALSEDELQTADRGCDLADTSKSTYVWLPIFFEGDVPRIEWLDEWTVPAAQ